MYKLAEVDRWTVPTVYLKVQNEGGQSRLQISADRPGQFLKLALISFLVTFALHPVAQPSRAAAIVDRVIL